MLPCVRLWRSLFLFLLLALALCFRFSHASCRRRLRSPSPATVEPHPYRPTGPKGAPRQCAPPAPSSCLGRRLPKPGNEVSCAVVFLREHHHRRPPSAIPRSSRRAREHRKLAPPLPDHYFTVDDPVSEPLLEFFFCLSSPSSRALHGEPLILPYPKLGPPPLGLAPRPSVPQPLAAGWPNL
jgi:hypothetical protein